MVVYIKVNFWSTAQGIRVIEPWLQIRFFCLMNLKNPIEEKYFLLPTSISARLIKRRANLCHTERTNDSAKETSSSLFKSANSVGWISRMEHFCSSDFREEEDRIERYVHTKTRKELISKCEHVLIREHSEMMWGSFQILLDFHQDEDLRRMYAMLSRIPESLEPLRKTRVSRSASRVVSDLRTGRWRWR